MLLPDYENHFALSQRLYEKNGLNHLLLINYDFYNLNENIQDFMRDICVIEM